ncbi:MAG: glycosyltransferase family 2 protein [Coriobacteriales bacterium]|jgi:glycosyltransferase involved in cell wall biosynthesis
MPRVSVIVPAYNAEDYIGECLASVLMQDLSDFELIVVDDGSTDSTKEIAEAFAANDPRVKVISQENSFAGVARNNGMDSASGEFLYFLDADDFIQPDLLGKMKARMDETSCDVVVCRSNFYYTETGEREPLESGLDLVDMGRVYSRESLHDLMFRFCAGWPWDKMFRTSFVKRHGLRFQALRTTNDAYFVFCALMLANKVAFVDESLVNHRTQISTSLERTRTKSWDNAIEAALAIEKRIDDEGLTELFRRSFLNWLIDFSVWNFETLDSESRKGLLEKIRQVVLPRLPLDSPDFFYLSNNYEAANAFAKDPVDALADLTKCQRDLMNARRELEEFKNSKTYLAGQIVSAPFKAIMGEDR